MYRTKNFNLAAFLYVMDKSRYHGVERDGSKTAYFLFTDRVTCMELADKWFQKSDAAEPYAQYVEAQNMFRNIGRMEAE